MRSDDLRAIEKAFDMDDGGDGQWVDADCQGMCLNPLHVRALIDEVKRLQQLHALGWATMECAMCGTVQSRGVSTPEPLSHPGQMKKEM
jgi:hypothetical protein